jgi:hypothetical protein
MSDVTHCQLRSHWVSSLLANIIYAVSLPLIYDPLSLRTIILHCRFLPLFRIQLILSCPQKGILRLRHGGTHL